MSNAANMVRAAVLPWKLMIFLSGFFVILAALQSCVAKENEKDRLEKINSTQIAKNVICEVTTFDAEGNMQLRCGKYGSHEVRSTGLALEHATTHRPLVCELFRGNPPDCRTETAK